jgi:hypothetical protein
VFQQILGDPGNAELNLRYAKLSAERGDVARAIAAYERVLAEHPDNETARRELARLRLLYDPPTTDAVVSLGARYESNAPRRDPSFLTYNDTVGSASIAVRDERVLGDRRWRSFANGYIDAHNRFQTGDLAYVGGSTGPLIPLPGGWTLRPALGAAYAARHYQTMYGEGAVLATFETQSMGPLEQVDLRFAAQDWSNRDPGKDALIGQFAIALRWREIAAAGDLISFDPMVSYNAADSRDNRYVSFGFNLGYVVPLAGAGFDAASFLGRTNFGLELLVERAAYRGPDRRITTPEEDRRDTYVAPGARLVMPSILDLNENWTLRYLYESNSSNEFINTYRDHTFGLSVSWRL